MLSAYTLMESTIDIFEYVRLGKKMGYQSLALTDCENMYAAIKFYQACQAHNIQPIIGMQVYYDDEDERFPVVLLSKNFTGYQSLVQLASQIQLGEDPLTLARLSEFTEQCLVIIPLATSNWWTRTSDRESKKVLAKYRHYFNHFYFGFSPADLVKIPDLQETLDFLDSKELGSVALPEIRMLSRKQQPALNVLKLLKSDQSFEDFTKEMIYDDDFELNILMPPEDYFDIYSQAGAERLAYESVKIASDIHLELPMERLKLPAYPETEGLSSEEYLMRLCRDALDRLGLNQTHSYTERLEKEIQVINTMGFADYFLIVWDICQFAHRKNILMGAGRGSAAGSLVAYLLGITQIDPLEYDLIFERFLNSERETMPDIDLDFPDNKREQIFAYLKEKYSADHVAHIATFGRFAARSALRDVGRVFGLEPAAIKEWSDAVPAQNDTSLSEAYQKSNQLQKLVQSSRESKEMFKIAHIIEGLPRHVSTHAAGVVLSENPLTEMVPLQSSNDLLPLTQYTMEDVEQLGLLKLDILALKNLTIIADTLTMIPYENKSTSLQSLSDIPLNDEKTMELFKQGNTDGVFQFESPGIRRVLEQVQPSHFEDLVAVNALYRPGPMHQINHFIARKHGKEPISYPHESLQEILEKTYGIMIYQEQVMQVAATLAGYSLNEADILRRAISKKETQMMAKESERFVDGVIAKGYSKELGQQVFDLIAEFAGYGFNRSHAVAYSLIAYQMAYLKCHFPTSFFAALLRSTRSSDKRNRFLLETRQYQVKIKGPHINKSWQNYTVKGRHIYFGLSQIKGLRREMIKAIIDERRANGVFKNFIDFIKRIDERFIDEKNLLPLIGAGAFDHFEYNRRSIIKSLPTILSNYEMGGSNSDLLALFTLEVEEHPPYSDQEKREQEYEYLDYVLTPMQGLDLSELYDQLGVQYISHLKPGKQGRILGQVTNVKQIQTKRGEPMSFVDVSDESGKMSWTLFPQKHRQYIRQIEVNKMFLAQGKVEKDRFGLKLLVNRLKPLEELVENEQEKEGQLYLRMNHLAQQKELLSQIQKLLKKYPGQMPVSLYDQSTEKIHHFSSDYQVSKDSKLIEQLRELLGENNVVLDENV